MGADFAFFGWVIWQAARAAMGRKQRSPLRRWGPLVVVALGCVFIILDPVRHVLLDHNGVFFEPRQLAMYSETGGLSRIGKFCQVASILGICLLCVGTMWLVDLPQKLVNAVYAGRSRRQEV
mmetsp:Transcript_31691/g.67375  ORF Transcript_31691/g.67375 Transcript_31691/m.67375 type:complete len:122 (+) Transcript_31691:726-1091(+)